MKLFGRTLEGFASAIAFLVAVFFVSGGLCGLSLGLESRFGGWYGAPNTTWVNFVVTAGIISGIAVLFALGSIVVVSIAWITSSVYNNFSGKQKNKVQKLFDSDRAGDGKNSQ